MAGINDVLRNMRKAGKVQDMKEKGDLGEEAVLAVCYDRKEQAGVGLLYQSFMYPYQTDRSGVCYTGNIKFENGDFVEYTKDSINDEIDVLYITPYRIFTIEVKSYHARTLDVYEHWFNKNSTPVDKSPVMQAEKHARHLYHAIYTVLPDGNPSYIQPMVCFVDRCKVRDDRSQHFVDYVPVCVLNNLLATINKYNTPLEYNLDLEQIERKLNEVKVSIKRIL
jgi:hypothetical protein